MTKAEKELVGRELYAKILVEMLPNEILAHQYETGYPGRIELHLAVRYYCPEITGPHKNVDMHLQDVHIHDDHIVLCPDQRYLIVDPKCFDAAVRYITERYKVFQTFHGMVQDMATRGQLYPHAS